MNDFVEEQNLLFDGKMKNALKMALSLYNVCVEKIVAYDVFA